MLLRLKMRHHYGADSSSGSSAVGGFKFFCMYAFLDKFVEQCPQVRYAQQACLLLFSCGKVCTVVRACDVNSRIFRSYVARVEHDAVGVVLLAASRKMHVVNQCTNSLRRRGRPRPVN